MARNKDRDQVWDIFREFGNLLTSPHWSAYVLDDQGRSAAHLYDRQARIALFAGDGAAGTRRILGVVASGADPMADKIAGRRVFTAAELCR